MESKTLFKLGDMVIDQKQVFWKMKYCYAMIPIVQILDGHVLLTTKRPVESYTHLEPVEVFDLTLTTKFLARALESYHNCPSSTIYIQNPSKESPLKQMILHIIPRKFKDLQSNDNIYHLFHTYPNDLVKHYNEKMNFYINAYANKILEGIYEQTKKYQTQFQIQFKQQKQT